MFVCCNDYGSIPDSMSFVLMNTIQQLVNLIQTVHKFKTKRHCYIIIFQYYYIFNERDYTISELTYKVIQTLE